MNNKDFDEAYDKCQDGDFFAISVSDNADLGKELAGQLIQYGTGAYAHIGIIRFYDLKMAVEAVSKGTVQTDILSYRGRKGVGITFFRLKEATGDNMPVMLNYVDEIVGEKHPYDWAVIGRLAGRTLLTKIPVIGFFINKLFKKLPFFGDTSKELFCSEVCTMFARKISPDFRKGYQPNQVTPTLFVESSKLFEVSRAVADPEC